MLDIKFHFTIKQTNILILVEISWQLMIFLSLAFIQEAK
jgi:hypothetical protein